MRLTYVSLLQVICEQAALTGNKSLQVSCLCVTDGLGALYYSRCVGCAQFAGVRCQPCLSCCRFSALGSRSVPLGLKVIPAPRDHLGWTEWMAPQVNRV